MTWNEFKKMVDEELKAQGGDGDTSISEINISVMPDGYVQCVTVNYGPWGVCIGYKD